MDLRLRAAAAPPGRRQDPSSLRHGRRSPLPALALGLLAQSLLALSLAGCAPDRPLAQDVRVDLAFEPALRTGPGVTCRVLLHGADGAPLEGVVLELEGNMNHAGMVPVFATPREVAPGTYSTDWTFTMGGDWYVVVQGDLPDGRRLEHVVDVPGVAVQRSSAPLEPEEE